MTPPEPPTLRPTWERTVLVDNGGGGLVPAILLGVDRLDATVLRNLADVPDAACHTVPAVDGDDGAPVLAVVAVTACTEHTPDEEPCDGSRVLLRVTVSIPNLLSAAAGWALNQNDDPYAEAICVPDHYTIPRHGIINRPDDRLDVIAQLPINPQAVASALSLLLDEDTVELVNSVELVASGLDLAGGCGDPDCLDCDAGTAGEALGELDALAVRERTLLWQAVAARACGAAPRDDIESEFQADLDGTHGPVSMIRTAGILARLVWDTAEALSELPAKEQSDDGLARRAKSLLRAVRKDLDAVTSRTGEPGFAVNAITLAAWVATRDAERAGEGCLPAGRAADTVGNLFGDEDVWAASLAEQSTADPAVAAAMLAGLLAEFVDAPETITGRAHLADGARRTWGNAAWASTVESPSGLPARSLPDPPLPAGSLPATDPGRVVSDATALLSGRVNLADLADRTGWPHANAVLGSACVAAATAAAATGGSDLRDAFTRVLGHWDFLAAAVLTATV